MRLLSLFFKEILEGLTVYAIVMFLFVFYYFVVPDYWFLCSLLTILIFGAIRFFRVHKNR
ncbi:hypothetical protein AV903_01855 [Erwinia tracheiphila]|uniref:Uncharacterized protein n=1 Tax=Erwinia tracheiphila TaxID=65700 RepID=A0A345CNX5_9GAMM|nr:hypothetical protein AV903_01855 [Erwinia tracheiphila]